MVTTVVGPQSSDWEGDALSRRASCSQFYEDRQRQGEVEDPTQASEDGSQHVGSGSRAGSEALLSIVAHCGTRGVEAECSLSKATVSHH